jgi:terminase small subunit-like protein
MPCTDRPKADAPTKPKRAAHRPSKFTPELGEKICELVSCGWLMKDAARHFGIPPETVCRWVVKHEAFRAAYEVARAQRTEIWAEEIIEIADDATRDYTTDQQGNRVFNHESVHRARLRIEARKWQMARLDPRLWGDRQQIDMKADWAILTVEERRRKADELIATIREIREPMQPPPLVYRAEEEPDDEPATTGGIGRQRRPVTRREG